jgi:hypothetical protein
MKLTDGKFAASSVKFSADLQISDEANFGHRNQAVKDSLLRSGLFINKDITPGIAEKLSQVCENLGIPEECVSAFVYSDPYLQASCITLSREECVLQFSSTLMNQLDDDEISFVIGHELGHFLLEHRGMHENDMAPESFVKNRAQEISADRLGLIGCGDLNAALRALIKTTSGLDSRLLRFDVGQFLSKVDQLANPTAGEATRNTHPSMLVRARSLVWFSSKNIGATYPANIEKSVVDDINKKVQADLDKYVDAALKKQVAKVKADIVMWLAALEMLADNRISEHEKQKFSELFSSPTLEKLLSYVDSNGVPETKAHAQRNLEASRNQLEGLIPHSFETDYRSLVSKLKNLF